MIHILNSFHLKYFVIIFKIRLFLLKNHLMKRIDWMKQNQI